MDFLLFIDINVKKLLLIQAQSQNLFLNFWDAITEFNLLNEASNMFWVYDTLVLKVKMSWQVNRLNIDRKVSCLLG